MVGRARRPSRWRRSGARSCRSGMATLTRPAVEAAEVRGDRVPIEVEWRVGRRARRSSPPGPRGRRLLHRRVRQPVHADDLGGHALTHLGLVARLVEEPQPRVGVEVDEPRRHHHARSASITRAAAGGSASGSRIRSRPSRTDSDPGRPGAPLPSTRVPPDDEQLRSSAPQWSLRSRIGPPMRPWRAATSSATMASPISAGSRPPRSRPIGAWSRASWSSEPRGSQPRAAIVLGPPAADGPHVAEDRTRPQGRDQGRLIDLRVVRQHDHRIVGPQAVLGEGAIRPVRDDDHALEPWLLGKQPPRVDDERGEARLAPRRLPRARPRARRRRSRPGARAGPGRDTASAGVGCLRSPPRRRGRGGFPARLAAIDRNLTGGGPAGGNQGGEQLDQRGRAPPRPARPGPRSCRRTSGRLPGPARR